MKDKIRAKASEIWGSATRKQRRELLKAMGFNEGWAVCLTLDEVARRDGGSVIRYFVRLCGLHEEREAGV